MTYPKRKNSETGKREYRHRQVAAETLGRPLLRGEVVHHKNEDKFDFASGNLIVLPSQSMHASLEHALKRRRKGQVLLFPDVLAPYL